MDPKALNQRALQKNRDALERQGWYIVDEPADELGGDGELVFVARYVQRKPEPSPAIQRICR